ncbi:hypothetical protein SLEP1_g15338 [Rubroshorea leprosula]|uniref:Uncharacterized protein n=1 Tax=Rubroshorea leprosula TaxID=152421 RepID=A0AAV5IT35_9ROSI|nr:hypothetical protein SLEP1_g15338 [Rubroshorea leprosula]
MVSFKILPRVSSPGGVFKDLLRHGNYGVGRGGGGGSGGDNGGSGEDGNSESDSNVSQNGVTIGWREGVEADPQFPLKVPDGRTSSIRLFHPGYPFHTEFHILMFYHLLTHTTLASTVFANSPKTHICTATGFDSGLSGTAVSNRLINKAKKIDPESEPPN